MKGDKSNGEAQGIDGLLQHPSSHQGWIEYPNRQGGVCKVEEDNGRGVRDDHEGSEEMICEGGHGRKAYQQLPDRRLHVGGRSRMDIGVTPQQSNQTPAHATF